MKRLYRKIYLTIIASLVVVVLFAGAVWRFGSNAAVGQAFEMAGELAAAALPPPTAPVAVQEEALARLAQRLRVDVALFDADRSPIAGVGHVLAPPQGREGGWIAGPRGPAWGFHLPDGRWLVARAPARHRNPALGLLVVLGGIALFVAICALPVARGLTRRLERLQAGVETLGAGNLATRVKIEGKDEVARLAASFNRAAARIEELVGAHRLLLANASHELRTPLTRIRLGLDMLATQEDGRRRDAIRQDIAELDLLIDEILLASRLEALASVADAEPVDLLALAAEECARHDEVTLDHDGGSFDLTGDARLLRRLLRNLLDNASRHGAPPVTVRLAHEGAFATITVRDGGPGIPPAAQGDVFAPFYRVPGGGSTGTGLGLSIVRQIARLHGGEATVAEPEGGRPGFRVTIRQ